MVPYLLTSFGNPIDENVAPLSRVHPPALGGLGEEKLVAGL